MSLSTRVGLSDFVNCSKLFIILPLIAQALPGFFLVCFSISILLSDYLMGGDRFWDVTRVRDRFFDLFFLVEGCYS